MKKYGLRTDEVDGEYLGNYDNCADAIRSLAINAELEADTRPVVIPEDGNNNNNNNNNNNSNPRLRAGGILAGGGMNGTLALWDYRTGHLFQSLPVILHSGSLISDVCACILFFVLFFRNGEDEAIVCGDNMLCYIYISI